MLHRVLRECTGWVCSDGRGGRRRQCLALEGAQQNEAPSIHREGGRMLDLKCGRMEECEVFGINSK